MDILICGINNYVGRRCTSLMADEDFQIFALTRSQSLFRSRMFDPIKAQLLEVDLLKGECPDDQQLPTIEAALYFTQVPALDDNVNVQLELLCLRNFIRLIQQTNCNRLIYIARLMNRRFLAPIMALLKEFKLDYTIVLKNMVVGKESLFYHISQQVVNRKVLFYSERYGRRLYQPIGIYDFVRWLKAMLFVPSFHGQIIEVGGEEVISAIDFFSFYRKLKQQLDLPKMVSLPNWLFGMLYRGDLRGNHSEMAEYLHLIQENRLVDNHWQMSMPFHFSSLQEVLLDE